MEFRASTLFWAVMCVVVMWAQRSAAAGKRRTGYVALVPSGPCGQAGQACCAGSNCNAGLYCDKNSGNTCQYNCGGIGQYCCSNSPSGGCNDPNTFCQKGLGSEAGANFCIENCGRTGQKCCRNKWCTGGFFCDGSLNCQPCPKPNDPASCPSGPTGCGDVGQTCCSGDTCVGGMFCDKTSVAGQKTCRPYCGAAGQRCCPVKSAGYDGCNPNSGIYCDDNVNTGGTGGTGLCTYNCGFENQQCCPRGFCSSGLNCVDAKCTKQVSCGGADQTCCANNPQCITGYFCFKGMCRQNCGLPGQGCCVYDSNWCQSNSCRNGKCD